VKASEHGGDVPDSVEHWSYNAPGRELWSHDYFPTKEQAIAAGRAYYGDEAFDVGRFMEVEVDPPDADDVIETMCCRMSDTIPGDLAELFIENPTQESRDELSEAIAQTIADWLTKHGEWPTITRVVDIESIGPAEGGAK
jgi:hypothetical protein